jgi:hypothetical protein
VIAELEKREGEQWRRMLALYKDGDIRIRYAAAEWTQRLVPELARDRMLAIDDEDWSEPAVQLKTGQRRRGKLRNLTTQQLVDQFVTIALEQDEAQFEGRNPKFNRLFWQMQAVEEELKSRDGDERRTLLSLYEHPSPQVRLKTAFATLAVAPDRARRALRGLIDADEYPQAMSAREMLTSLDEGRFRPI